MSIREQQFFEKKYINATKLNREGKHSLCKAIKNIIVNDKFHRNQDFTKCILPAEKERKRNVNIFPCHICSSPTILKRKDALEKSSNSFLDLKKRHKYQYDLKNNA